MLMCLYWLTASKKSYNTSGTYMYNSVLKVNAADVPYGKERTADSRALAGYSQGTHEILQVFQIWARTGALSRIGGYVTSSLGSQEAVMGEQVNPGVHTRFYTRGTSIVAAVVPLFGQCTLFPLCPIKPLERLWSHWSFWGFSTRKLTPSSFVCFLSSKNKQKVGNVHDAGTFPLLQARWLNKIIGN